MNIIESSTPRQAAKIEAIRKTAGFTAGRYRPRCRQVKEGERSRYPVYEGVLHRALRLGIQESFTVAKLSSAKAVERVFPVYSPLVEGVEIVAAAVSAVPSSITCAVARQVGRIVERKDVRKDEAKAAPAAE